MEACWSRISFFFIRDTGRLDQASMLNIHRDVIAYLLEHTNNRFCTSLLNASSDGIDWIITKIKLVV